MANIKSQIKRNKQNLVRQERNKAVRSELKTRTRSAVTPAPAPAAAITRATPSSARTIAVRSNGTSPRSSRMNAAKASSISSDEPSARAQRFAASRRSTLRPS